MIIVANPPIPIECRMGTTLDGAATFFDHWICLIFTKSQKFTTNTVSHLRFPASIVS